MLEIGYSGGRIAPPPELSGHQLLREREEGRYELRSLPPGRYTLSVARSGYLQLQYGQRRPLELGTPFDVVASAVVDIVDFVLPRMSVISGRVLDEEWQPMAGIPITASNPTPNSQIAPVLGRNVGSCRGAAVCNANVNIDLIPPNSVFEDRLQQLDVRIARIFRFGKTRLRGNFDIYNALNGASILSENAGYGAKWLTPYEIMGGRLFKFSGQIDF